tara:strand:+ start:675 stop:1328 length:654 start_codon:yes stop_codon:yes gene_type:complete
MKKIYSYLFVIVVLASCSTSYDVVSNRKVQKRKYTKGLYVKSNKKNTSNFDFIKWIKTNNTIAKNNHRTIILNEDFLVASKEIKSIPLVNSVPEVTSLLNKIDEVLSTKKTSKNEKLKLSEIREVKKEVKNLKKQLKNENKITSKTESQGPDKQTAIILCCLGFAIIAGLHRLYLGYYGLGILYILTGGLCLIGTIIDLIKLLNGDLLPNGGSFDES